MRAELEEAHRQNCKIVLGVAKDVPNPTVLSTIGWLSLDSYIDMIKILFLIRTICLPVGNFYREFVLNIIKSVINLEYVSKRSPVNGMIEAARKYNLVDKIMQSIENNAFGSYLDWKKLVKGAKTK